VAQAAGILESAQVFDEIPLEDLGSIAIRVVVLPPKPKKGDQQAIEPADELPLDLQPEEMLPESGSSPLGSYLESGKGGKRCCVFLVNGQRQDALDNSFIVQELGFKYLRNRMMIIVDADGLTPEAIGRLMQGSRQGFYKGDIWNAIVRRVVATLKNDPELMRLEEEAEEQISELETGDEKVKHTLDQLIDAHHDAGLRMIEGAAAAGDSSLEDNLGVKTVNKGGVVSLLPPDRGTTADYPVLFSVPASSVIRVRPNQPREIAIKTMPGNAWPALAFFSVLPDARVLELQVDHEKLSDHAKLTLLFREPANFDSDQYPVRARLRVWAGFNGIKDKRQLDLRVLVKPDKEPPEPVLLDEPTRLKVSSREPVKIRLGQGDTHVRMRWDGKDRLLTGPGASWKLAARMLNGTHPQPMLNFSVPKAGRFSLLISPRPEWEVGNRLEFEVVAIGPKDRKLYAKFLGDVVAPLTSDEKPGPRLVDSHAPSGASRRPPYELMYIDRDRYDSTECWGDAVWTDEDPGCFLQPTARRPLTLIINKDMATLREYRRFLTRSFTEQEVERRITKYTSHVAFHLYQMYQAAISRKEDDLNLAEARRSEEIRRVAMTLIKLMEVSR
jgi:hypothetical protein